ncbi:MAG: hypothetical protein ACRCXT_08350 [Paraclostridium sp.]
MRITSIKELNKGCIVATFNVCYDGLTLTGFRLIQNKDKSYFVSPPSFNVNGMWISHIKMNPELLIKIRDIVLDKMTEPQSKNNITNKYSIEDEFDEDEFPF